MTTKRTKTKKRKKRKKRTKSLKRRALPMSKQNNRPTPRLVPRAVERPVATSQAEARALLFQSFTQSFSYYLACWTFRALYAQIPEEARNKDARAVLEAFRHQLRVYAKTEFELKIIDEAVAAFERELTAPLVAPKEKSEKEEKPESPAPEAPKP
jgi:hypothetical protein